MKVQKYIDILNYWKNRLTLKKQLEGEKDLGNFVYDMTQIEDKLKRLQICVNSLEGLARNMQYCDYVYEIVKENCKVLDSIYGDYIESLVGTYGLKSLIEANLVESCGVVNGRQLYTLCDKK